MNGLAFTVYGNPKGKGRPRFGGGRTYTDGPTVAAETAIRDAWVSSGKRRLPDTPLALSVELYVPRPKTHYRADGRTLSAAGAREPVPARKPDLDNAAKLIMDALNGLAYRDDVQITQLYVYRYWSPEPRTEIRLSVLEPALAVAA